MKAKGPLHARLQQRLRDAWIAKTITQESLAKAIGNSQENTGQYLRGGKAGSLDLDQARAALHHIGSSLEEFLAAAPPRELTEAERIAIALADRPELMELLRDLLPVPKLRLDAVVELARGLGRVAKTQGGSGTRGPIAGRPSARRTKSAPKRRRAVPGE